MYQKHCHLAERMWKLTSNLSAFFMPKKGGNKDLVQMVKEIRSIMDRGTLSCARYTI